MTCRHTSEYKSSICTGEAGVESKHRSYMALVKDSMTDRDCEY